VGARVGRLLTIEDLEEMTQGLARAEAYRLIAERVRHDIVNLRDRTNEPFDIKSIRQQWKDERRVGRSRIEADEEEFATIKA